MGIIVNAVVSTLTKMGLKSLFNKFKKGNASENNNNNADNTSQKTSTPPPKKPKKAPKKFSKVTLEDVNDSLCQLEYQLKDYENEIEAYPAKIDELMLKGKNEKSKDMKIYYAKKINMMKEERKQKVDQMMYLMYNIKLLDKLKITISNNEFFSANSSVPLNSLLGDQKGLASFLNQSLGRKIAAEQIMTEADDIFQEVESQYDANETIYGSNKKDEALLAMFEEDEQADTEKDFFAEKNESTSVNVESE